MKTFRNIIMVSMISLGTLVSGASASSNHSGQALKHAVQSGSHASGSVAHVIMGSAQVASAAVAIPLAVVGSVGEVSKQISENLMDAAFAPIGTPLEVSDESFVVGPPPNELI